MIRVVLAVTVGVALLGVSLPAVEEAGISHAETRTEAALDEVETAARTLERTSEPAPVGNPARATVRPSFPAGGFATAALERLTVRPDGTVRWQVRGGRVHETRLADGLVRGPPGGLTVRGGGSRKLLLVLRQNGTVGVRRLGFMSEDATTAVDVAVRYEDHRERIRWV